MALIYGLGGVCQRHKLTTLFIEKGTTNVLPNHHTNYYNESNIVNVVSCFFLNVKLHGSEILIDKYLFEQFFKHTEIQNRSIKLFEL